MLPLPQLGLKRPSTLDEAVALMSRLRDDAQLIAGGTDVLPNMKQGLVSARTLVSLQRIDELRGIRSTATSLRVGSMTTLDEIASSATVRELAPALAEAADAVGGPHHRRMGTLGGNLCLDTRCRYYNQTHFWRSALGFCLKKDGTVCHVVAGGQRCVAAASNDTAPALLALGASIVLCSAAGERSVEARSFYTADGIKNTTRSSDEIVKEIVLPIGSRVGGSSRRISGFDKLRRRNAIDFPLLSVAAAIDLLPVELASSPPKIASIEIVVSALAARPRRLGAAQRVASGTVLSSELTRTLSAASLRECKPLDNIEGDPEWRHEMVGIIVSRLLQRLTP